MVMWLFDLIHLLVRFWNLLMYNVVRWLYFLRSLTWSEMYPRCSQFLFLLFVVYRTALMLAALGRHTDCVHILLEKGANADAADKKGFTALHRAVSLFDVYITHHFIIFWVHLIMSRVRSFSRPRMFQMYCIPLTSCVVCSSCRPCWAVRTVYLLCWNMEPLLCVETLREEPRCTSQHPSATRSYSELCL